MTPAELDHQMRRALTDDLLWRILTSDNEGRDTAVDWLRNNVMSVRSDRKIRQAQSVADQARYPQHTSSWHQVRARFADWESRSRRFEALALRRLRELGFNEQGHRIDGKALKALDRARGHAETCEAQMKHAIESLADLASLVEAHVNGTATVTDLDQALDDLTVCKNDDDTATLRELLAGKRRAYRVQEPA